MADVKERLIEVDREWFERIPVKTHVLADGDDIVEVVGRYLSGVKAAGDWVVLSEKAVAATQGRAIQLERIAPSHWARFLSRHVRKVSYGIGLSIPETMEMAIREVGLPRILFAATLGAATRAAGWRGVFYQVAGRRAAAIDGPTRSNIPPYDGCVILAPADPDRVCREIQASVGVPVAIVDVNDIGSEVLGATPEIDQRKLRRIMRDNPLGQGHEQTPLGIVRRTEVFSEVAATDSNRSQ